MPGDVTFEAPVAPLCSPSRWPLSTREFNFVFAQKVGFWLLFRVRFGVFALKNQLVFGVLES
jgi:hypothetical protein